ncbi:MAG TPA: 16S rRNA (guanine(527)-N(7))-methyltransferase RsmG [Ramlibacter sp.]|nr:16S rRNA (guanine(527)-N(7))-methyltransferase RsmG [Ramlibacter sp.]
MEAQLRAGAEALGVPVTDTQVRQLIAYAQLLQKWGKVYNLTALLSPDEVLTHHLLDSLAVAEPLRRTCGGMPAELLDVGSGAGLPGAVISVIEPRIRVDCVDAVAKKAAFVQQVSATLGLANLHGIHSRVEQVAGQYRVITSRAFASLVDFVQLTRHALAEDGVWMAMKGKYPADEVAALPPDVEMFHVEQLQVPGLGAERRLLWLRRRAP